MALMASIKAMERCDSMDEESDKQTREECIKNLDDATKEWDEVVEAELSGEVEGGCMELRLFKEVANMACCSNMAFERQPLQKGT